MRANRRQFFQFMGATTAAAGLAGKPGASANVRQTVDAVEHESEQFPAGAHRDPSFWFDVVDGIAYDRIRFPAGSMLPRSIKFFAAAAMGGTCPYTGVVKTEAYTSMHSVGCFSAPNNFLVQRYLFAVHESADMRDLSALSRFYSWYFLRMQKYIQRGPVMLNPFTPIRGLADLVKVGEPIEYPKDPRPSDVAVSKAQLPAALLASSRENRFMGGTYIPTLAYFEVTFVNVAAESVVLHADLDLLVGLQGAECRAVA